MDLAVLISKKMRQMQKESCGLEFFAVVAGATAGMSSSFCLPFFSALGFAFLCICPFGTQSSRINQLFVFGEFAK